jgi:LysM repeat protein
LIWYNHGVQIHYVLVFLMMVIGLLTGCSQAAENEATVPPIPQSVSKITPYASRTPIVSLTPTALTAPTPTPPPLPTPTPFLYTVVENDTLIGIASTFGITLDELMVANPDANPNTLSIGTQLVIPLDFDEGEESQSASVEVLSMQTSLAVCYPVRSGGLWCYWLIHNQYDQFVENIAGIINLYNDQQEVAASQKTMSLVNIVKPGEAVPLIAYFSPPLPRWSEVQGQLINAAAANQYENRYLTAEVAQLTISPIDEERQASQGVQIAGLLRYPPQPTETEPAPSFAWVLAVAYDAEGVVVGVRRWEIREIPRGGETKFSFKVYSLGKPIERVDVLAEMPKVAP